MQCRRRFIDTIMTPRPNAARRLLLPGLLLAGLLLIGPAPAARAEGHGGYTPNPDTATERRDLQMGTGGRQGAPFIGQDPVTGDQVMETAPRPPVEQPSHNATIEIKEVKPVIIWPGN